MGRARERTRGKRIQRVMAEQRCRGGINPASLSSGPGAVGDTALLASS